MKLARSWSVCLIGLHATMVEVEVWCGPGLPQTIVVGMADTALREARQRCKAAAVSAGLTWPVTAVTINLTPAALPKSGSHYDLAIVAALAGAGGHVPQESLEETIFLGELGLDGRVRTVRGVLPSLLAARDRGFRRAVVPASLLREARLVEGLTVIGVERLVDALSVLRGEPVIEPFTPDPEPDDDVVERDLSEVVGQPEGKWALEVAAAGGHHVFFTGPPGVGKTLLAERLSGLLPDLSDQASLEVSAIHSLSGRSLDHGLIVRPPYASPHHSASVAAIVGGGSGVAYPGAVSLAHRGVLFLDEAPEFSSKALEALRTPLESGLVEHYRAKARTVYPARFQLVLASNPCPCGMYGDRRGQCTCSPMTIRRYSERLSGPIMDRIDIQQRLLPLKESFLKSRAVSEESTAVVAARVAQARERQRERLRPWGLMTNAQVSGAILRKELLVPDGVEILDRAVRLGTLSARGVDKVVRLAWTIADISELARPTRATLHTALAMRRGELREDADAYGA